MENKMEDSKLAELVEVRVKLYSCRICGIRYDNMPAIKQHHLEVHTTAEDGKVNDDEDDEDAMKDELKLEKNIKQEIDDEDEEIDSKNYVLVDEAQLNGIELGENQMFLANNSENGQIVLQVIQSEDGQELIATEQTINSEQTPPTSTSKRGRKRKNVDKDTSHSLETISSSRPKRVVVPNIKSEFVYEGISHTTPIDSIEQQGENSPGDSAVGTTYTLVQEGDVITAWQTVDETNADSQDTVLENVDEDASEDNPDEYPPDYTPTSKAPKGRINEPKDDDFALRRFPCPFQGCNYIAKYRSNLWDHKKTHTGEKPYVCTWPSCTMRFSQTHQLKLHLRSHTGERPYVCDWPGCNSAFSQKPGLKSHMLTHTGEKPFKCDFPGCGWTFRLKGALTDHKRAIHENAKKHVCEWPGCNKRFLQQCHLKKHIMGHADIKPFACDWPNCNYKAVTMAYVTNHRKTHTGEKNYECTYPNCNKRFVKSSHVNRHRTRCHPDLIMMVDDNDEVNQESGSNHEDSVSTPVPSTPRARRGAKRENQILYKLANQGEEETSIFIQQEQVEEEMISDGVQFINGSVVSDEGGHYIISEATDESVEVTPIMIQLKKEDIDQDNQTNEDNNGIYL